MDGIVRSCSWPLYLTFSSDHIRCALSSAFTFHALRSPSTTDFRKTQSKIRSGTLGGSSLFGHGSIGLVHLQQNLTPPSFKLLLRWQNWITTHHDAYIRELASHTRSSSWIPQLSWSKACAGSVVGEPFIGCTSGSTLSSNSGKHFRGHRTAFLHFANRCTATVQICDAPVGERPR